MIPGGFSAGDEPDGSGKFIANALRNENGYYILDPLLCTAGTFEYCVYSHTRRFYDDPTSVAYRGKVYRIEQYT
jgi:hypothetical protein